MLRFRYFALFAIAMTLPVASAADKIWTVSNVMVSFEACPQTASKIIAVEGYISESLSGEDGMWTYDLLDKQDDDPLFSLAVYSEHKLNVRDNMRVRVTGRCTRKGSMDNAFPALWVDRFEVR